MKKEFIKNHPKLFTLILFIIAILLFICFLFYQSWFLEKHKYKDDWYIKNNKIFYYQTLVSCGLSDGCSAYGIEKHQLKDLNPNSFQKLSNVYAKDNDNVYATFTKIEDADAPSFEIIEDVYAKDKNKVYIANTSSLSEIQANNLYDDLVVIENVNPSSFEVLDLPYSKDENTVYYYGKIIEEADTKTFVSLKDIQTNPKGIRYNAEDKNYIFFYGEQVGSVIRLKP